MRRVTVQPGDQRRPHSRLSVETQDYRRLDQHQSPMRQMSLDLEGMAPMRAQAGASMEAGALAEPERRRSARGLPPVDGAWDEVERLGWRAQATAADLDFEAVTGEYEALGGLTEETFARLAAAGIPRRFVEAYIEGQEAIAAELRRRMVEIVGGEERFAAMLAWAETNLPEPELLAFDEAVQTSPEHARMAIEGLYAAYQRATGAPPALLGAAGPRAGRGGPSFGSTEELVAAIRDPRYKKDPAYRADVEARLARSNVFKR